ncbi:MAG: hypothetical protein WA705_12810 [Candidatus Ozemobacteraceae bacterium]
MEFGTFKLRCSLLLLGGAVLCGGILGTEPVQAAKKTVKAKSGSAATKNAAASDSAKISETSKTGLPANAKVLVSDEDSLKVFPRVAVELVDEASENAEINKVRENLLDICAKRDLGRLIPFIGKNMFVWSGSESRGLLPFLESWGLATKPSTSYLWAALSGALKLGGHFLNPEKTVFQAPYLFNAYPESFDPQMFPVVIGRDVNFREKPELKGRIIDKRSFELVRLLISNAAELPAASGSNRLIFDRVQTFDGKIGYIAQGFLRSARDYRVTLEKRYGRWIITSFVQGE